MSENHRLPPFLPQLNQYTATNGDTVYYDSNFNMALRGGWFFYYDAENRLTKVGDWTGAQLLQNTYDGLGRCVKRDRHDWGNFVQVITYDGWKPVVEWDGAGNLQAWNVYGSGPDEILWRYQNGTGHLRYHHDVHGNVSALLDWSGNLVEKYSYDAFGLPTVTDADGSSARTWSNWGNPFMFTGREYFPGLWLYDYRHRWYDPRIGRFLQMDPTGFDAGDMNLFRYCADDPIDRSDPTGLYNVSAEIWRRQRLFDTSSTSRLSLKEFSQRAAGIISVDISLRGGGRAALELRLAGNRHQHVPYILDENGRPTGKGGLTVSELKQQPVETQGGKSRIPLQLKIDVYYADKAGPITTAFTQTHEPEHAQIFDDWFEGPAARIVQGFGGRSFDSSSAAGGALDTALRPSFNEAYAESALLDKPNIANRGMKPDHDPGVPFNQ